MLVCLFDFVIGLLVWILIGIVSCLLWVVLFS